MPSIKGQSGFKMRHKDGTPFVELQRELERRDAIAAELQEEVRQLTKRVTTSVEKPEEEVAESYTRDIMHISYESFDAPYDVTSGVETPVLPSANVVSEPLNRNTVFKGATAYPPSIDGDGWIPMGAQTQIVSVGDYSPVKLAARDYAISSTDAPTLPPFNKEFFVFTAPVNGIYNINASLFIELYNEASTSAWRIFDNVDAGMLVMMVCPASIDIAGDETLDPLNWRKLVTDSLTEHSYVHNVIEMKSRLGDLDPSRNSQYQSNRFAAVGSFYANSDTGMLEGIHYGNRFMHLGSKNANIALNAGEQVLFWYKLYGRRFVVNGSYYDEKILDYCHVAARHEKVDITLVDVYEDGFTRTKENIKEIIKRF